MCGGQITVWGERSSVSHFQLYVIQFLYISCQSDVPKIIHYHSEQSSEEVSFHALDIWDHACMINLMMKAFVSVQHEYKCKVSINFRCLHVIMDFTLHYDIIIQVNDPLVIFNAKKWQVEPHKVKLQHKRNQD